MIICPFTRTDNDFAASEVEDETFVLAETEITQTNSEDDVDRTTFNDYYFTGVNIV